MLVGEVRSNMDGSDLTTGNNNYNLVSFPVISYPDSSGSLTKETKEPEDSKQEIPFPAASLACHPGMMKERP